jgi:hypothetical protein
MPTLAQIFQSPDAIAAGLFIASAIAGQLGHGVKQSLEGETTCVDWFRRDLKRTLAAMIGNLFGMIIFIQTGVLGPMLELGPKGFFAIILFGISNGFSSDSALNKSTRASWTDEERAARKVDPDKPLP